MKIKCEIVKGQFGHLGMYFADRRIAGEKPWGGGQTIMTFTVDLDRLSEILAEIHAAGEDEA